MADHTADITRIAYQERELQLPTFDLAIAWQLGSLAHNIAEERSHAIAIEIRRAGKTIFLTARNGTTPSQLDWLRRKANTCEWFGRSSYSIWLNLQLKQQTLSSRHALSDRDFAADGGAFPIAVAGTGAVGALIISGLDQRADHELAVEVLCHHLNRNYADFKL
jgi:uncharacterized protein (UPF0303 family)